ncbi:DUF4232 domain-containing protein [Streptomyces tremellae]|uniref:DUF4232 domain-containing protein n=1 Tax=Streptomyces tremellae TaxID=1124239 RepID=A0ABP7G242_9ACTN
MQHALRPRATAAFLALAAGGALAAYGPSAAAHAAAPAHATARTAGTLSPAAGEPPCTTAHTRVTVAKVVRPVNHMLLTVTNTGSTRCAAYGAPVVGFDGDQSPLRVLDDSVPQAVVELEPGDSAYAGILLSSADGSGTHGHHVTSLRAGFENRDLEPIGTPTTLPVPGGAYEDDSAFVTYWQSTPALALLY